MSSKFARHTSTALVHAGLHPRENHGFVNPPVYHASTVLFPDAETMQSRRQRYVYGRRGTPTSESLTEALTELEGAAGCVLTPSGLSAIALACLSCLKSGDHFLVADSVYQPTRHFCDSVLGRLGVETTYFDPGSGAEIGTMFRENTCAVFTESPGSLTMEIQDIKAISQQAHDRGAIVLMDNTWATPLYFRPLEHGVDLSIQAGTKYIVGHSDVMLGTIAASGRTWERLSDTHGTMGFHVGPDDVYLAQRGLRTMGVRLQQHMKNALHVALWLKRRDEVGVIYHPALPDSPGHALWKRDFTGASGLFSFELEGASEAQATAFLNALELFGLGFSWGGFESLALRAYPEKIRTAMPWKRGNPLIRLHIGLEDTRDLTADLENGFAAMQSVPIA